MTYEEIALANNSYLVIIYDETE